MPRAAILPILALLCLAFTPAPAIAGAVDFCPSYGVACWRTWTPEERPGFLSRWMSPDGQYVGSIYLPAGQSLDLPGLRCRPEGEELAQVNWDASCNANFPECEGGCFAR